MSRWQRFQEQEDSSIDLTPMLDVVFILLIFFIVSSNFVQHAGVDIQRPSATSASPKNNTPFVIGLSEDGTLYLDGNALNQAQLRNSLLEIAQQPEPPQLLIDADERVASGKLVSLIDLAKQTGHSRIAIAADQP